MAGTDLVLAGRAVDLTARVLVAGVVPAPRFGREGEVLALAAAVEAAGADLVDLTLPPRLAGPAARAAGVPVAIRAGTDGEVRAARAAGAHLVLVAPDLADRLAGEGNAAALAVVVDDLGAVVAASAVAGHLGLPVAVDASRWSGPEAVGREAAAVALGCRLIRTTDVRRSRRVAEVMGAILVARGAAA